MPNPLLTMNGADTPTLEQPQYTSANYPNILARPELSASQIAAVNPQQGLPRELNIDQGAQPQAQPMAQADPKDVARFHQHASTFFNALTDLASKPQGQLSKDDLFRTVASLMGQGLFSDQKSQQGLVMQLAQLPDDENTIRQLIAREMMQTAHVQNAMHQQFGTGNA